MASVTSLFERIGGRPGLLRLLNHFYADVRQHKEIGPIFNAQVTDWKEHIENIADFWTQITGGPAGYGGRMPQQHIPLGLCEEHFQAWLRLWSVNCRVWVPLDCANELTEMANQISLRLRQFCGVPQPPSFKLHP